MLNFVGTIMTSCPCTNCTHIYTFIQSGPHTYLVSASPYLTLSHIPPVHHCSIVIPLCQSRGIKSCVTELLSDIRAVQMDDRRTTPWPTDKKPSLFLSSLLLSSSPLSVFLPLSFSESTAAVICYTGGVKKKKRFSQDSLQGHILQPLLGTSEGTGNLMLSSHHQWTAAAWFSCCSSIISSFQWNSQGKNISSGLCMCETNKCICKLLLEHERGTIFTFLFRLD